MNRLGKWITLSLAVVSMALLLTACSGSSGGGTGSATGVVKLDVTDAPALDYAHVYVTVTGLGFHTDASTGFADYSSGRAAGWHMVTLATPKTIDLAQLSNGTMYADLSGSSLFDGITLPVGRYQQMRIFLASTEDAYLGTVDGLVYNNEVQLNGDSTHYPLRVPSAESGIKVVPESPVVVTEGGAASLALDFNLADDVVPVAPNGSTEFLLKPRLGYFDMGSVGAVKGTIGFGNLSTSRIEVKAEQVKPGGGYRMVRRSTSVDRNTGSFRLYPLPVFGSATTAVYDILVRGRQAQTAIIKGVTVHRGTNPSTGVDLGTITLQPGADFTAQLGTSMHPSGAWLNFYQTVGGDPIPYEVRNRHLDPYTGRFGRALELSAAPVDVATYLPGQSLVFTTYSSGKGQFSMVADAGGNYARGAMYAGIHGSSGQGVSIANGSHHAPQVGGGASAGSISGMFDMALMGSGMGQGMGRGHHASGNPNSGQLFVVSDGMIVDGMGTLTGDSTVGSAMHAGGGQGNRVTMTNLPSGVPGAMYNVYALGWGNGVIQAGSARGIDLRGSTSASATIRMK